MIYALIASHDREKVLHLDQRLSHYSQSHNREVVTFSHHSIAHLKLILDENPIRLFLFDVTTPLYIELLVALKQSTKALLCIGFTTGATTNESALFVLGMDDLLHIPMSDALFLRRMQSFLHLLPKKSSTVTVPVEESFVFDDEDLEDLSELLKELHLHVVIMERTKVTRNDLLGFTFILGKIQSYFMYLVATFPIAHALHDMCEIIENQPERFMELAKELSPLAVSFVNDLERWKVEVMHKQTQNADFLNASIVANVTMFISFMFNSHDSSVQELDSIFDF